MPNVNTRTQDPEIPVPGRPKAAYTPNTPNQKKANEAADMLKVPGRETVRGAAAKRKQMLDEF